jgi:hypothetical protein
MAHDQNLNPLYKERKRQHGEQAGINFDARIRWMIQHFFLKTEKPNIIFWLDAIFKTGKDENSCKICTQSPVEKVEERKLDFSLPRNYYTSATQIHPPLQMTAFRVSNSNANGVTGTP